MKSSFRKKLVGTAMATALIAGWATPTAARAEEHASAKGESEGAAESQRTDILDLGAFQLRRSQLTDREIIDLKFGLTLVLSSNLSKSAFDEIESWKNRVRDQVIIAVRSCEKVDLADPQLKRIQRLIMFRIRRLPISDGILGMYVTDFSMDEGESLADLMTPPVKPSPPKKEPPKH